MIRSGILIVAFFYICLTLKSQTLPLHPEAIFPVEYQIIMKPGAHTSVLPFNLPSDSAFSLQHSTKPHISAFPVINALGSISGKYPGTHFAGGIRIQGHWSKYLSFSFHYALHHLNLDSNYLTGNWVKGKVIPHYGLYSQKSGNGYLINDINFAIAIHASKYIDLETGIGKHRIGDGYRSLFLSTNAPAYPYFKTSLHFWKISYFSMVAVMKDYLVSKGYQPIYQKYVTLHYLSFNLTKKLNFSLFESVIWERADTLSKRSLDINYLNPVIFYRPIEYNIGSPDNVIMGIGSRWLPTAHLMIYGQFLIDEFYLKEVKAGNKWWGNKNAWQLGLKIYNPFHFKPMILQLEYNQARPYTYSHNYQLQNYGYLLQPLAHPLGSNFREITAILRYGFGKWNIHAKSVNGFKGVGSTGTNVGGDIYQSNSTRQNDYNNEILQGNRYNMFREEIKLCRTLVPSWNLQAEITSGYRIIQSSVTRKDFFITIGLRTLLYEEENLL